MNEKLTVRNFGPITEAEVEFKRVTVFIGPTGGGKSTLAKLAAIFREVRLALASEDEVQRVYEELLSDYQLEKYDRSNSSADWKGGQDNTTTVSVAVKGKNVITHVSGSAAKDFGTLAEFLERSMIGLSDEQKKAEYSLYKEIYDRRREEHYKRLFQDVLYVPADRAFIAAADEAKWELDFAGITLPRTLVNFARVFEQARHTKGEIESWLGSMKISVLDEVKYTRQNDGQYAVEGKEGWKLPLADTSSGMQSVITLLVALSGGALNRGRHLILEEPELNLFPNKQKKLLEKLVLHTTGSPPPFNDARDTLLINTHSPYILSHLNLLIYAHQVATKYPDRTDEVAQLVPRESWINPQEFAAYYVGEGTVRSIVNPELGLIDDNELDAISGDQADAFDNLIRLSKGFAIK